MSELESKAKMSLMVKLSNAIGKNTIYMIIIFNLFYYINSTIYNHTHIAFYKVRFYDLRRQYLILMVVVLDLHLSINLEISGTIFRRLAFNFSSINLYIFKCNLDLSEFINIIWQKVYKFAVITKLFIIFSI
jgi:hypothetical protein